LVAKPTRAKDADGLTELVAYATLRGQTFGITADAELVSAEATAKARVDVDRALATVRTLAFTTVACLQGHGATLDVSYTTTGVHLRAALGLDAARACLPR
jgi:hypothetical protein